ncbi:MAG TPA: amidohydrolase family protein, partial [Holophaga sp.]|nr:amidohydrolase family protein [Holophaga sp.]
MSLLIQNAILDGKACDLLLEGDRIARIGEGLEPPAGCERLDAGGLVAVPSLVNGHAHSSMVLLRGIAEDMALMPWLTEAIWPIEGRMTPEDAYWGMRLAALEMIRTGTTLCNDMYMHPEALALAARDSGMRFVVTYALIDGLDEDQGERQRQACVAFFDRLPDCGPLSRMGLAGHSVYA